MSMLAQNFQNSDLKILPLKVERPPRSYSDFSKSPNKNKDNNNQSTNFLYSWGMTNSGQLFNLKPNNQKVIQSSVSNIQQIALGEQHSILVNIRQEIIACGSNQFGQLALETLTNYTKPTMLNHLKDSKIASISCGAEHTFCLTTKGEVYSWGLNLKGQLGLGTFENINNPTLVYSLLPFGNSNAKARRIDHNRAKSSEFNNYPLKERSSVDNILEQMVYFKEKFRTKLDLKEIDQQTTQIVLANDEVVASIVCGALHTVILTNKNRIMTCGNGGTYALGHEDTQTLCEFKPLTTINLKQFTKPGISPRPEKVERISAGLAHTGCIIDGRAYIWGKMGTNPNLIFRLPTLMAFRTDDYSHDIPQIIDLKMGECFTLFLSSRGEIYSMGENIEGQLGIENANILDQPTKILNMPLISQIQTGRNHCFAVQADLRTVYAWGSNQYGQIDGESQGSSPITTPKILFQTQSEILKIVSGSFHNAILCGSYFDLTVKLSNNNNQSIQEDEQFNFHYLKGEYQRIQEEIEKERQENQALKMFNLGLIQKTEKLKTEISQTGSKKKEFEKKCNDQKSQASDLILEVEKAKKSSSLSGHKRTNSKIDISGLEVSPERPIKHRTFTNSLDVDFSDIHLEKQINEGGYGIIYKARWRESIIALKMFKLDGLTENIFRDFLSECHAMEAVRHPNIVMFLGACTKPPNLSILLEFCSKGSLWSVLQNHDIPLSWDDRRRMALDTARAVHYLHCFSPPILHRDLKSLNLLLDDALRVKLADFGWTRTMSNYMTSKIGTYQWMAPEVIGGQTYTEKADVFSYGIILWEIASREPPYRNISGPQVSVEVLNNDLRPTIPKKTPEQFAKLMRKCWDRDPEKRPSFKEIIKELEYIRFNAQ